MRSGSKSAGRCSDRDCNLSKALKDRLVTTGMLHFKNGNYIKRKELLKENTWNFPSKTETFVGSVGFYSNQNIGDLK